MAGKPRHNLGEDESLGYHIDIKQVPGCADPEEVDYLDSR